MERKWVTWNQPGLVQDTEAGGWKYVRNRRRSSYTWFPTAKEFAEQFLAPKQGAWVEMRDEEGGKLLSIAAPNGNDWYGEEVTA